MSSAESRWKPGRCAIRGRSGARSGLVPSPGSRYHSVVSVFAKAISEYATRTVHGVAAEDSLEEADRRLRDHSVSALGVFDGDGVVIGVCSRTDLLRAGDCEPGETLRLPDMQVRAVMSSPALTMKPSASVADAAKAMLARGFHRVFLDAGDGKLAGVLSTLDLARVVRDAHVRTPTGDIASRPVVTVDCNDTLGGAVDRLEVAGKHGLVVFDRRWPVGLFTQEDALIARAMDPMSPVADAMDVRLLTVPPRMPLERAAAQAVAMGVHRVLVVEADQTVGIVSGLDFARAITTS